MAVVTLKNGSEENTDVVALTMAHLRNLMAEDFIAFYELVKKCREPDHKLYSDSVELLKRLRLLDPNGTVNKSIRNIVLSAAVGSGMRTSLTSPLKEPIASNR